MNDNFFNYIIVSSNLTQNIYNLMAILGFFFSGIIAIKGCMTSRKNIKIKVIDSTRINSYFQIFVYLQNQSRLPICISSLELKNKTGNKSCPLFPKRIYGSSDEHMVTPQFPINLMAWEGRNLVLQFPHCADIELSLDKTIALQVYSNR